MMKALIKLFSDVAQAEKAMGELKAKGYQPEEVGVLSASREKVQQVAGVDAKAGKLEGVGSVFGTGKLAQAVVAEDAPAALAEAWGLPKQSMEYYETGLARGGLILSIHADESRLASARKVFREVAPNTLEPVSEEGRRSGFQLFDRMTETNMVDRQLSGDFRKY
jgi:hypothetical protein